MKRNFLLTTLLLSTVLRADAQVQHTALDTNFATQGLFLAGINPSADQQCKIALGRTGSIILAKTDLDIFSTQPGSWLRLRRLQSGGGPDNTFGTGGLVERRLPINSRLAGLVVQQDDKIVVAGSTGIIDRFLANGGTDSSFNDSGRVRIPFQTINASISGLVLDAAGKILVTGTSDQSEIYVQRFLPDGRPDSSFGFQSISTIHIDFSSYDNGRCLALQADGKILVAFDTKTGQNTGTYMCVLRLDRDGIMDYSFHPGSGIFYSTFPQQATAYPTGLEVTASGKILLCGEVFTYDGTTVWPLAGLSRLLSNGMPDTTFGGTDEGILLDTLMADPVKRVKPQIAWQSLGDKIVVVLQENSLAGNGRYMLRQLLSDGTPDYRFGNGGRIVTDLTSDADDAHDVIIQPDGKILVAGMAGIENDLLTIQYNARPFVARYRPDAELGTREAVRNPFELAVFPNPVTSTTRISFRVQQEGAVRCSLLDASGKTVQEWLIGGAAGFNTATISLSPAISAGNYQLLIGANGYSQAVRIQKR